VLKFTFVQKREFDEHSTLFCDVGFVMTSVKRMQAFVLERLESADARCRTGLCS
jgi:hypothetical protein